MADIDFGILLKKMDGISNDIFPNMLFDPVINLFDDGIGQQYWTTFDESNEVIDRAMNIKAKIKDYGTYLEYLDDWYAYMNSLAEIYGSIDIVLNGVADGVIKEFIPPMPTLKMNKTNKQIKRSGIIPSRKMFTPTYQGYFKFVEGEISPEWKSIPDVTQDEVDAETQKLLKAYSAKMRTQSRMAMFGGSSQRNDVLAQLSEIYSNLSGQSYRKDVQAEANGYISLKALKKERKRIEKTPDWLLDWDIQDNSYEFVGGRVVQKKSKQRIDLFKFLVEIGFDPVALGATEGMRKDEIKVCVSMLDDDDLDNIASGKKFKKLIKKKRKEKQSIAKAVSRNPAINRILFQSSFSLMDLDKLEDFDDD